MKSHNEENPEEMIRVRIGVTAGEPVDEAGDLFGTPVNLAARLCSHARPDGILVDKLVQALCPDPQFTFSKKEPITPKGFDQAVQVYEVIWQ